MLEKSTPGVLLTLFGTDRFTDFGKQIFNTDPAASKNTAQNRSQNRPKNNHLASLI